MYSSRQTMVQAPDGVRLSVREWGRTDGAAIVFVHGWSHSQLAFLRQFRGELAESFRLVSYDLRGHGESDHPDTLDAYNQGTIWGDDLRAVIEALQLEQVILVGWSFGGRVIAQYVHQFAADRVAGLSFVAVAAFADPDQPVRGPDACGELLLSSNLEDTIAGAELFVRRCARIPLSDADFALMLGVVMSAGMKARQGSSQWRVDYTETFRSLRIPTLVVHGRQDGMTLPHAAEAIAAKVAGARVAWFEACGHMPFWEEPERFNAELSSFARDCYADGAPVERLRRTN
ncbi:alpha/beta fold hydrolase [Sphingomonas crusticola]|uniref:alpha/beta fold hydrolase n=1 Tax=Sphingomonas crusticola TaxID=1697973 RepID=UPI000E247916|nr:alpha/beta hydrolase [Sphingomonas crusticola]